MRHRILVVADDPQIVRLVQSHLEQAGFAVLTAYDGAAALRLIRAERPDLVVLDLRLPDQGRWAITRAVRADASLASTPIIMLTTQTDETDTIAGLAHGADDYVGKPCNLRELVARVRAVLRRGGDLGQGRVLELSGLRLDIDRRAVTRGGQPVDVTPTEFELLKTLMANPGHTFTRAELIEKSLGCAYDGLDRGVDSHIKNLRKKIEPDLLHPTYIQTVYGIGYRLGD